MLSIILIIASATAAAVAADVIVAVIIAYFAVTAEAVNEDSTTLSFQQVHI